MTQSSYLVPSPPHVGEGFKGSGRMSARPATDVNGHTLTAWLDTRYRYARYRSHRPTSYVTGHSLAARAGYADPSQWKAFANPNYYVVCLQLADMQSWRLASEAQAGPPQGVRASHMHCHTLLKDRVGITTQAPSGGSRTQLAHPEASGSEVAGHQGSSRLRTAQR